MVGSVTNWFGFRKDLVNRRFVGGPIAGSGVLAARAIYVYMNADCEPRSTQSSTAVVTTYPRQLGQASHKAHIAALMFPVEGRT